MNLIIDLGAHNGADLGYYLKKARRVVAVEANPWLCDQIRQDYEKQIREGRLFVEEKAVVADKDSEAIEFWLSPEDAQSSLVKPRGASRGARVLSVATISLEQLFAKYGIPQYLKIDLEHYDSEILRALGAAATIPPALSVEAQKLGILDSVQKLGTYSSFKLVRGKSISRRYQNFRFLGSDDSSWNFSFPWHSAGPLGEDLPGAWFDYRDTRKILKMVGPGWVDVHAATKPATRHLRSESIRTRVAISTLTKTLLDTGLLPEHMRRIRKRLVREFVN